MVHTVEACHPGLVVQAEVFIHVGVVYPLMDPELPGVAVVEHLFPIPKLHLYCAQHV